MTPHVLLFSINGEATSPLIKRLASEKLSIDEVRSFDEVKRLLRARPYRVLILSYDGSSQLFNRIIDFIQQNNLPTKVILLSKKDSVEDAVHYLKAGASDFIVGRSLDNGTAEALLQSINQIYESSHWKHDSGSMPQKMESILIGNSPSMQEVRTAIRLVAKSNTAVLITGESGTGKEIVARMIHLHSDRADQPFFALNCAALPKDVIENELFGHEKGAFTGALIQKSGCFELADKGTLFFDEIAEMSIETQAKLLRAIETQSFRRLGGREEVQVNVRTIAATNKKMAEALKAKEFREDLYYRFSVIEIFLPPLRERREDIPLLVDHFLKLFREQYKRHPQHFHEKALEMLTMYDWPGNVRELRNVIERSIITCQEAIIHPRYLPERITSAKRMGSSLSLPIGISLREAERKIIQHTIATCGNNKSRAAELLGISRKTLHTKLRKIGI